MAITSEFHPKILSRGRGSDDYSIYRAALEWDLTDPIVIENADDFKSTPRWRERLDPYHHQVTNLITFCRRLPVTLLADDVGLGKTISAGLIMSELATRGRLSKTLVVCPKLLGPQWREELESKFQIPATIATGRELIAADPDNAGAIITTYNSARLYLEDIPEDRFEMLILDEAHKLRNLYGVQKPPQVAKRFRKALEDRRFRFVLMLTATPIQNRLWDLYSLVDLLTVARGHNNPFGSEGMFARRFIADEKDKARQLKPEAREEFRSIVYGYMSRVRRGDAKLLFPDRVVQMHRVNPTRAELQLISVIAKPIQKMNRLAQIGILQDLVSSPEALSKRLNNMVRNGTAPVELATAVKAIVDTMPLSAKLAGLGKLIEKLKTQNPNRWRLVVFTTRRETQTTIQNFLETHGLKVGLINGDSGERNQETIKGFWRDPPKYHVIVSTEAGSEGINLQIANVLVNYDLPWNPMIVEQRIGRLQRLASEHAHVSIFNITLRGTFEEYIVGRLMEKLQMAAHAIGDIEALLQGSDIADGDEDSAANFENRILALVLAALAGKDVEKATRLAEKSIDNAKADLEREERTINEMLGSMDGKAWVGPRAPKLPDPVRSMDHRAFTLGALPLLGARLTPYDDGLFLVEEDRGREFISFDTQATSGRRTTVYSPTSPAFQRLVKRVIASGLHAVEDTDRNPAGDSEDIARRWAEDMGARFVSTKVNRVQRSFCGQALLRVRATVAHDSYERIVSCECIPGDHTRTGGAADLAPLPPTITDPTALGLNTAKLITAGERDDAIAEFSRFYLERREQEMRAAGSDNRKRKKLEDDFTPRLEMTLVGLEGAITRQVSLGVSYSFDSDLPYQSEIVVRLHDGALSGAPDKDLCSKTGRMVPQTCLAKCEVTGAEVMRHLLVESGTSGRLALPEFTAICALSGKRVLNDEVEVSAVTGQLVASALLKTSTLSGKRAEPEHFQSCAFTNSALLQDELAISEISGKPFRIDEQLRSAISGRTGHKKEFVECYETRQLIAASEAERCDATGRYVRPGILEACSESGQYVLPSELARCAVTGKRVLKRLLVSSSVSQSQLLERAAIRSSQGNFCTPAEARECFWSGRIAHPDDLRTCTLTGLPIHAEFATASGDRLRPLAEMLDGARRTADEEQIWTDIAARLSAALNGKKCRIEAATLSPAGHHLATCSEIRTLLGWRVRQAGAIYNLADGSIFGRITEGSRNGSRWEARG
jgi:superfamily II DNA or RNA helicase